MNNGTGGPVEPEGPGAARRWQFGEVVLDERSLELKVQGRAAQLDRKPLEVLRHLLRNAGDVVTKDELIAAVWPGRVISDSALTSCVARLREGLKDQDQAVIKTVHGYGYRLVAPVRVYPQRSATPARFDFKPGDHPPGRPLWSLVRRLGTGGHGEAWLGQHDKTREQRVFKFAVDGPSLGTLKREITLYRLLNDTLGVKARIVELLDWNLEQEPCFIESRHIAGGNLVDWAERNGGPGAVPLPVRIEVSAEICDALAAVHSVGVLHKDLKPSNVLVEETPGAAPGVRLADLGSGGLMDHQRLEQLGITGLGFTRTLGELSGTPLYLAPEVIAGQPPTVRADIYALGVLIYQLVLGDFRASMSPGWERNIGDELLRECIADAAQGDPERRLGDSAELALRLRTLEQTRKKRRLEREAQAKAEEATHALDRLRARRAGLAAAGIALVAGIGTSTALYLQARQARDEARAAAANNRAVAEFLSRDLFAVVSEKPLRNLTVQELLESAAANLARRERDLPQVSGQLHAALGNAFLAVENLDAAEKHLDAALRRFEERDGADSEAAIATAGQLFSIIAWRLRELPATLPRYEQILAQGRIRLGPRHPEVLNLEEQIASTRFWAGDWRRGADDLRTLIELQKTDPQRNQHVGLAQARLAEMLVQRGEFGAAVDLSGEAVTRLTADTSAPPMNVAIARSLHARALVEREAFEQAEAELLRAEELLRRWMAPAPMLSVHLARGLLRLRQGRSREAIAILEPALAALTSLDWFKRNDTIAEFRTWLAYAYNITGRPADARRIMQKALEVSETQWGVRNPMSQGIRIGLADIVSTSDTSAAHEVLRAVDRRVLADLGEDHPYAAQLLRVEGLLAQAEGRPDDARKALREALRIFEARYGSRHSFTKRARTELARADRP